MLKEIILKFKNNRRAKQAATLLAVNILGIPSGIISSILITKYLGAENYGNYIFLLSIFNFSILIFDFGFIQAGNRALVLNMKKNIAHEYYGAELICIFLLFVLMTACLSLYGYIDKNLYNKELIGYFVFLIPFGWVFLMPRYYETLFQANNRINDLALSRLLQSFGNLCAYSFAFYFLSNQQYDRLKIIIYFYLATNIIVFIFLMKRLNPSFKNIKKRLNEIWYYTQIYGFHVYTGSVFAVGLSQLSGVLISYFSVNNSGVGQYSLALVLSMPLKLIPNTIATTHYRDFSMMKHIPRNLTIYTIIFSVVTLFILCILITPFITYFYGDAFISVAHLTIIISIGTLFYGMADYINRFLGAHGEGKFLRNSAIIVGLTLLLTNIIFIRVWGVLGAALAQVISGFVYFFSMAIYYVIFLNKKLVQN